MAFFTSDNPIALFLALVVVVVVLKLWLEKHAWFKGSNSSYILPILLAAIILLIAYRPLLRILSFGLPFLVLIALFIFGVGALVWAFGMKEGTIGTTLKGIGLIRVTAYIVIFCVVALAVSRIYGERLLDDKTVTLADPIMPEDDGVKVDFAPFFTSKALGMIFMMVVLGLVFYFVNSVS